MFPPFLPKTFWTSKETPQPAQRLTQIAALLTLTITAAPLQAAVSLRGVYSSSTASARDPALDQTLFSTPQRVTVDLLGIWLNKRIVASPLRVEVGFSKPASTADPTSAAPGLVKSFSIVASPLQVLVGFNPALSVSPSPVFVTSTTRANWVKWSTIGALDFTILKDNLAGERPLDWKGKVHALKKLGNKVVAYGENGISILTPAGNAFGLETIARIGLKSKQAVAGTDSVQYLLDKHSQLWELSQGLTFLDYSEYLSELGSAPVLSYDPHERLLYLCDGTKGFVYDPATKSLGRGPVNVTGIGVQDGTKYVTAPAAIAMPLLAVTTDIYDFGTRRAKTIQSIEVGIDTAATIQIAIEYRQKIASAFASTSFYTIDNRGVKPIGCYGYEFRFLLKSLAASWGHLDYLKVNGHVHDH